MAALGTTAAVGVPTAATATPRAVIDAPVVLHFLQANIGNINVAPGACNDQAVKLCLRPVEARLQARLAELAPDVVALQETLPGLVCEPPVGPDDFGTPATSASLLNPQHLCSPGRGGARDQIDRLLPPQAWDTRCNAGRIDSAFPQRVIPPWDCVGVRRDRGSVRAFRTLPGTAPGAVPGETCDNGFTVNLAQLQVDGRSLQVTSAHPDSGSARAGCRAEKLGRLFAALGGRVPTGPTIVSGDMNLDPYRAPDVSTELWDRFIGAGPTGSTPYVYRSGIAESDPPPFSSNICGASQEDPTGLVLDGVRPPAPTCASTLDHVASTPDITGPCITLNDAARLDGGGGTDHSALSCTLTLHARTAVPAAGASAGPDAAAGPAGVAGGLPATGPSATVRRLLLGLTLLLLIRLVQRRRAATNAPAHGSDSG